MRAARLSAGGSFAALHAEPLWLREDYRKPGTTAPDQGDAKAAGRGRCRVRADCRERSPAAPPIAARLGFERLPGALFWLHPTSGGKD
jgi:hypothetical protein